MNFYFFFHYLGLYYFTADAILSELVVPLLSQSVRDSFQFYTTEIQYYLDVFADCTKIVIIDHNKNINLGQSPIILSNKTTQEAKLIDYRLSFRRIRNPSRHCWAIFDLLSNHGKITGYDFQQRRPLANGLGQQFLIYRISLKNMLDAVFKTLARRLRYLRHLEIILIGTEEVISGLQAYTRETRVLNMQYHNVYHRAELLVDGNPSKTWYAISCFLDTVSECFNKFAVIGQAVTNLNKYFVGSESAFRGKSPETRLKKWYDDGSKKQKLYEVADLVPFTQFVSFWTFQDAHSQDIISNITPYHSYLICIQLPDAYITKLPLVLAKVQTFSFISCYKVKSDTVVLSGLVTPFDIESWLLLFSVFLMFVIIFKLQPRKFSYEGAVVGIGMLLESSILWDLKLFPTGFPAKLPQFGIRLTIGVWAMMSGTVLTNWYKAAFTMEMIVPVIYLPPWQTWLDIDGMQALLPIHLFDDSANSDESRSNLEFFLRIYNRIISFSSATR